MCDELWIGEYVGCVVDVFGWYVGCIEYDECFVDCVWCELCGDCVVDFLCVWYVFVVLCKCGIVG